jgi:signal transduction histidine kinase
VAGFPLEPAADRGTTVTGSVRFDDGDAHLFAATALRAAEAPGVRWIVLADLDRSGAEALRDLVRTLPIVILLVTVVGVPIALLLARSVTGPLRRLASATADLPSGAPAPLPVEGPAEIRELVARFNAMAAELRETRDHERRLLADLRHDLRTPLTVIGGFAAALADGTATGDDAARAARAIGEESTRLERLVAELDALERLQAGSAGLRPEPLDAAALVEETVERFAPAAAARGLTVEMAPASGHGDPELAFVADRLAVDRILANLVDNALAASGERGRHVWIGARPLPVVGRSGPGVALMVTDDGPGFGPGQAERIFERFYRGDPSRSGDGSGLGLAIVRDLARAHGGDAVAENVAPQGARISVLFPRSPRLEPASTPGPG